MSKHRLLPEPLVWLASLALSGVLALPLAMAENGLTLAGLLAPGPAKPARPAAAPAPRRPLALEEADWRPPTVAWAGPPAPAAAEAAELTPKPGLLDQLRDRVRPQVAFSSAAGAYENLIAAAARKHQVSPLLIKAVIQAESRFDPKAVSHKGAVGLMQVMPLTGRSHGVRNLTDPRLNLEAGVKHLKELLVAFEDDEILALAAYNCGTEAMKRFNNEIPPFPETRNYVKRVMNYYRQHLERQII